MLPASANGDKSGIGRRDIALAFAVPSPGDDGVILAFSAEVATKAGL